MCSSDLFVGYPTNQCGFLVWCPQRGPNAVVSTTNVVFGSVFPKAKAPHPDLLPDAAKEVFLSEPPIALTMEEVHRAPDVCFVGTWEDCFVLSSQSFDGPRSIRPSEVMSLLHYTCEQELTAAHTSLVDSFALLSADIPAGVSSHESAEPASVPRNVREALSAAFVEIGRAHV